MNCRFCCSGNCINFELKSKIYYYCTECRGVFLSPDNFLSEKQQMERYKLHNNTLEDSGYKTYLENFYRIVMDFVSFFPGKSRNFLDYGSGPVPCFIELVKSLNNNPAGSFFSKIDAYDLYFTHDFVPDSFYDLITCLEVAEHFENPEESFKNIFSFLKAGGILAVKTQLLEELSFEQFLIFFTKWWYKEDATHVSFYTKKSLISVCRKAGLDLLDFRDGTGFFVKN